MAHEELLSQVTSKYLEAKQRKEDYEMYYKLAHTFGILSQERFDRCSRPGKTAGVLHKFLVLEVLVVLTRDAALI